ncbi:MAG: CvpA family protein [Rickettsiaceae bacterium]|nr:CvpA family protein [Rickettsiaceae bacterium]
MSFLDVVILMIIAISAIMGLAKGAIMSTLNLVLHLLTLICTFLIEPLASEIISEYIPFRAMASPISIGLAYTISAILFSFVASTIKSFLSIYTKGPIDIILGLGIGIGRGIIISFLLFTLIGSIVSGSYIGASTLWELVVHIDAKLYPVWLKKGYTYNIMQDLLSSLQSSQDSTIEKWMKELNMPAPEEASQNTNFTADKPANAKSSEENKGIKSDSDMIDQIQNELMPTLLDKLGNNQSD